MLSFKPTFALSSYTFIKRFSSSLSAIRVVSSAYLRLLIFLPVILILACASSILAFCMMYSAYKLNNQGDNIQPRHIPFPIWIHTVKGFSIVNKAQVDVFLELSSLFNDPADVGNLISGSSALSKSSLNIWKFTVHVLLKPGLGNLGITLLACEMSTIVQ